MEDSRERFHGRRKMLGASALFGASLLGYSLPLQAKSENQEKDTDPILSVRRFGASGKREQDATKAFRSAIEAANARGGGKVVVPPGEYTVGTIELKSNIDLHIEAGATLYLSQLRENYSQGQRAMIFADNAVNISVSGKGKLDGLAQYDYAEMRGIDVDIKKEIDNARSAGADMRRYYRKTSALNAFMFILNDCINVTLTDIAVMNSPLWTIRLNDCNRVFIRGVHIYSDLEKGVNADGIDIVSCSNVTISDCVVETADDAIVLKTIARNNRKANPCQNITVTNCILTSSSTALMIGTETEADIHDVLFNNCVIRNSNKGFGINVQDGATVRNVIFSNLTIETNRRHWNWWGSAELCKFLLMQRTHASRLGTIRDIVVDNVVAHTRGTTTLTGHERQPLENITFSNVQVLMDIENAIDKRVTDAIRMEQIRGLNIRNLTVKWTENKTEDRWQSALVLKNVTEGMIESFRGRQGRIGANIPAIILENVSEFILRNSFASSGTATFVRVAGERARDVSIRHNEIKNAKAGISFETEKLKNEVQVIV